MVDNNVVDNKKYAQLQALTYALLATAGGITLHGRDERLIVVPRPLVTMLPTRNAL